MPFPHVLALGLLLTLSLAQPVPSTAQTCPPQTPITTLYVSTAGNDQWSGLFPTPQESDGPLATLRGARDKLRGYRQLGCLSTTAPIHVKIQQGEYVLAETLVLEPQDSGTLASPVIFEAYSVPRPVITGGERLTGFAVDGPNWRLQRPEFQINHPRHWNFEQLWVNGRRAIPARSPNRDRYSEYLPTRGFHQRLPYPPPQAPKDHFLLSSALTSELTALTAAQRADVQITHMDAHTISRNFIDSIDILPDRSGKINLTGKMWTSPWPGAPLSRLEFLGVPSALDAPGEFYLDRDSGVLLYRPFPGEAIASAEVIAPRINAPELVLFDGNIPGGGWVEHLRFERLDFRYSPYLLRRTWIDEVKFTGGYNDSYGGFSLPAAITLDGSRHVELNDLEITHTGATALWMRGQSERITVKHCRMHDLGGGGIKVLEYDPSVAYSLFLSNVGSTIPTGGNHVIENNVVQSGGRSFYDTTGILIIGSANNLIAHNDVGDFHYSGISLNTFRLCHQPWEGDDAHNAVFYNRVHHIGQDALSDLGGIYFFGLNTGTLVYYNEIYFVRHWGERLTHFWSEGGGGLGFGLYLDSGSHWITLFKNVVYDVETSGLWLNPGQGRVIRNNVFAFTQEGGGGYVFGTCGTPGPQGTVDQNIFFFDEYVSQGYAALNHGPGLPATASIDRNLYYKIGGNLPQVGNLNNSPPAPRPGTITPIDFSEWQSQADAQSIIADPLFVDPYSWNFQLQPGSPALDDPVWFSPIVPLEPVGVVPTSPAAAVAGRLETPPADFGGMFGFGDQGLIYGNPFYGDLPACPPSYTETRVLGTPNLDYFLSFCHRPKDDRPPLADFGGMFGWVNGQQVPNVYSGTFGCAAGFTQKQVLGSSVDADLFYCYRPYAAGEPAPLPWGGMFGYYYDALLQDPSTPNPNPLNRRLPSCPSGFSPSQVFGTNGEDYPVVYCVDLTP